MIKDKEQNHKNTIEKMEENKMDLINKHSDVIADLNNTIGKQMEQLENQKIENEKSELELNNIKNEKQMELNNKFYEYDNVLAKNNKLIEDQKAEIECLNNKYYNLVKDKQAYEQH